MRDFIFWGLWIVFIGQTFAESESHKPLMDSSSHGLKKDPINPQDKIIKLKVPQISDNSLKKEGDNTKPSQVLKDGQNHPWTVGLSQGRSKSQGTDSSKNSYDFNQDRYKRSQEIHDRPYKKLKASDPSAIRSHLPNKKYIKPRAK
jgi:hypothetical protein